MLEKLKNNWQAIKEKVRDDYEISSLAYDTWIEPLEVSDLKGQILSVVFTGDSTDWAISYLQKKFRLQFQIVLEDIFGTHFEVNFISEQITKNRNFSAKKKENFQSPEYPVFNTDPKYTFDRFVVGANNQLAHAAALSVAENPGERYNPLFIYGGSGLGKTHLMHAIANFIYKNNMHAKILYVTSEAFMNELIEAIHKKNNTEALSYFKNKYRNVDILLIDDIQFLIGRAETTMEEFFNTFNYLIDSGKQIVISSDTPPNEFTNLEERLKSRFMQGLTVDISLPDYETRMAILRDKAEHEGYNIDNEILNYIATNIKSNIRTLEGALTKISAYSKLNPGRALTLELAKENLKDQIDPESEKKLTPENIIAVVADYFAIRPEDIKSSKRNKEISTPRHIAMYLIRVMTDYTLDDVGKLLGNRDHTTISYGFEKITNSIKEKEEIKNTIEILKKRILQ